jgi:hypothetical protein
MEKMKRYNINTVIVLAMVNLIVMIGCCDRNMEEEKYKKELEATRQKQQTN